MTVESDPTKLRQILVNLLSNAVKFTQEGHVALAAKVGDDQMILTVSDTGIGIGDEYLSRIFDPFWQVEQKATRRASGTGLGLTVSRRLANLLGGDVAVMSEVWKSTTFTVTLPGAFQYCSHARACVACGGTMRAVQCRTLSKQNNETNHIRTVPAHASFSHQRTGNAIADRYREAANRIISAASRQLSVESSRELTDKFGHRLLGRRASSDLSTGFSRR